MNEMQLLEVLHMKTLTDCSGFKHLFSVPITCPVTKEQKAQYAGHKKIALKCTLISPDILAIVEDPIFFDNRKEEICTRTFGTFSLNHPKVERIIQEGDFLLSGAKTRFLRRIIFNDGLD